MVCTQSTNDFGASMYFAYDAKYLYILVVFIDDVLRDDNDTSDNGTTGYLNDGFEFFLDPKGDSKGCVGVTFSTDPPFAVWPVRPGRSAALDATRERATRKRSHARSPRNAATSARPQAVPIDSG